jgi:aminoglycoside phosphotransferase (APT) family kinase protein
MFESQDTSSLTSLKLAALATSLLPKKHFTGFQEIDDSFDDYHSVLLIDSENNQYILRTPSSETSAGKFAAEVRILKELQGKFSVPELLAFDNRIAIFKTFRGKAYAPGVLNESQVKNLAKVLAKLHSLPFSIVDQLGLPSFTNQQQQAILLGVLDEVAMLGRVPGTLLSRFEHFLEDGTMWGYDSVVINADLRPRNVIFDGDDISCILSWSTLQGQDPAYDLAGITPALDSSMRETFLNAYRKTRAKYGVNVALDANLDKRAEFYAQFELVTKLLLAKASGNEEEMDKITGELEMLDERLTLGDELKAVEVDAQKKLQEREAELAKQELQDNLLTERVEVLKNVSTPVATTKGDAPSSTSEKSTTIAKTPDDILTSSPSLKTISDENASDIELELKSMLTAQAGSDSSGQEPKKSKSPSSEQVDSADKESTIKNASSARKTTTGVKSGQSDSQNDSKPFRLGDYITDDIKKSISESEDE